MMPSSSKTIPVSTKLTRMEPMQPSRLEKNTNIARYGFSTTLMQPSFLSRNVS